MREVWIVAQHEYLTNIRRPGFIIMTILIPALGLVALLIAAFAGGQATQFFESQFVPEAHRVGVVDHSGIFTPVRPEYAENFLAFDDEKSARDALMADELDFCLVIPGDYVETGEIRVVSKAGGLGAVAVEDSTRVRAFIVDHLLAGQVDPAVRRRVADPIKVTPVMLGAKQAERGGPLSFVFGYIVPYILSVLFIVTIFVASGYLLQGVAEEKETRVIEIVLSSVSASQLLAGKVLGLGALGLTQVMVWMASALALGGGVVTLLALAGSLAIPPRLIVLTVIYYLLGFLLYAVLMASAGSLGATMRESQQLAGIFSSMAAIPYMLSGFLFTNPNMTLARVLSYIPLTAPTMMMLRLPVADVPTVDIIGSIISLAVGIPVVLWAGAKVFRMGLLMYGKRPTLSQVWRSLREA